MALVLCTTIAYWEFIGGRFNPLFKVIPGPDPSVDKFYDSDVIGEGLLL